MIKIIRKELILFFVCIFLLIIVNYDYLDSKTQDFFNDSQEKRVIVTRVIDGDTIIYGKGDNETRVRLLGINSAEKGEKYYQQAKDFLNNSVFNKSVKLVYEEEKFDRYGRELVYIIYRNKNINLEMVRKGFANYYFPTGKNNYYGDFLNAWKKCVDENVNLCKNSNNLCSDCIFLEETDKFEQKIVLVNNCGFDCNLTKWSIKDEGRKKFIFPDFVLKSGDNVNLIIGNKSNNENTFYWNEYDYVWTYSGDTLFLRDSGGRLVLWKIIN
ncbi:MAG TPA: thermonuclease family protein [Candidatus Nanoarchaeia archaeon]|nr:thermonuclease family protein [Candidatus Nanoarchaeia archaeon]